MIVSDASTLILLAKVDLLALLEKGLIHADEAIRYLEGLAMYGRYHRVILDDARRRLGG